MANPFLVLGGIAVGIITAAFGVLAVPGWVASAQDASAKNDLAQVTIGQSASLSATGYVKPNVAPLGTTPAQLAASINGDTAVGVSVTTQNTATIRLNGAFGAAKEYAVIVPSASGKVFIRINGGPIKVSSVTTIPGDYATAVANHTAGVAG